MDAGAFYLPERGGGFLATELTRGPWDAGSQHAGPPAALLARAVEQGGRDGMQLARITVEIPRPVPIGPVRVASRRLRGGRGTELVEATMEAAGVEVMRAVALRVRVADLRLPDGLATAAPLPGPDAASPRPFFATAAAVGYHTATEWRFLDGAFQEAGPATVWTRMRVPLLPGEPPSPVVRVLVAADSGNGVSGALDPREWLFVNADLTVSLHRQAAGEWVALDARTTIGPSGVGLAATTLHDRLGPIGRGLQTLFVASRSVRPGGA